ncbi:uncharacterized protein LOC135694204 [Rhopilema esculentum]|uniref:uncharacterized protein LOC135694204 n=1 Tax=Rhopilema esculentum TaxID=499914 RepID=UPI0031CF7266|eukprot:gene10218-18901_t
MDCTRSTVFPYDTNEGVYGDLSSKYSSNAGSYYRSIPYNHTKGYSSPVTFGKATLTNEQPHDLSEGNFSFGHGESTSEEKCHYSGEHYLHANNNTDFTGHNGHGYLRISTQDSRFIQQSGDMYQQTGGIDSFGSMMNGSIEHFPHSIRSSTAPMYPPDIKFNPETIANQLAHDFGKFGPYGHASSFHSHRFGPSNGYNSNSYYASSDSTITNTHSTVNNINTSLPTGLQHSSSLGISSKLQGNVLSRNSITPTGTLSKDSDVEQVDETHKCKNTIEGTKTSVRRFKKWYREKYGKNIDMNTINKFTAPELLKDFFTEIRDTRPGRVGNDYEPVTLTTYRNGLRRYFLYRKVPPAPDNFDLTDKTFDIVNRRLMTKRDDLKRKGKGNHPNAIESITPEQLDKMWASGAIGIHAPRPLLRLQWWLNTVFHGIRGRMAHHDLSIEDFRLTRSPDGKLCVEYIKGIDRLNSPKTEASRGKRRGKGRIFETDGSERDPVRAFETYKAHRPPSIGSFYLTPKQNPKGNIWFNKVPMGKNSIGRIMREIKAIAGIN